MSQTLTVINHLSAEMKDVPPSPVFISAALIEHKRFKKPPKDSKKLTESLAELLDEEEASSVFSYAALAELRRLVDIAEKEEDETPEGLIKAYFFIAEEYMALCHYRFAREYYLFALEHFKKCPKDIFENEEMAEAFEESCVNLIKIYTGMGEKEAADNTIKLIIDVFPDKADNIQKRSLKKAHLKYDPVEYTDKYLAILPELEAKIEAKLEKTPRRHGFCFEYWNVKEEILKRDYGIEWDSPSMLNPTVRFD